MPNRGVAVITAETGTLPGIRGDVLVVREIGSDFPFDPVGNWTTRCGDAVVLGKFAESSVVLTDSGRTALRLALRYLRLSQTARILVPSYVCESVLTAILAEQIAPVFYAIDAEFSMDLEQLREQDPLPILVIDYFGIGTRRTESLVRHLTQKGYRVLHDVSHSFLAPVERVHDEQCVCLASIRKTLPLPDGGLVAGGCDTPDLAGLLRDGDAPHAIWRTGAMMLKSVSLANPERLPIPFRDRFVQSEEMLDGSSELYTISTVSKALIPYLDLDQMARSRRQNFQYLLGRSVEWPSDVKPVFTQVYEDDVPLGFPVFCSQRDSLRRFLIERRIYPPVHWPLNPEIARRYPVSADVSDRILTIPCDHRYGPDDMDRIARAIVEWGATSWGT